MNANTSSVCVREIQKSIQQSVKRLLEHKIEAMNAGWYFTVQDAIIKNNCGRGIIIFQGLQNHTADSIKSLEGFDRVWVEEAQSVSQWSMDILRPTFRKPGSEMWFTWNPRFEDDAVEKLFRPKNGEPPKNTILQIVNYLDNPFCPREAIEEAEYCARHDPDRYAHIWMGDYLTNSDARVFNNFEVREFELPDGSAFRTGIDWGFAISATAAVRCCLDGRTLYIDHEAYKVNCEIFDTPDLLLSCIPDITRYPAVADSARPETISYVKSHGIPRIEAAKKGKDSVEEGVEWLRSLRIVIHPRCKNTIYEFSRYMYKIDERTNDVLPQLVDRDNHCIAEGENVLTHRGIVPIEDVRVGDLVLTRNGFRRVLFSGITDRNRLTMIVRAAGVKMRCTPDHKVFTANRGFVRADDLRRDDELLIARRWFVMLMNLLGMAAIFGERIQMAIVRLAGIISGAAMRKCRVQSIAVNANPVVRVYDLTVDGQHEFFASRILVSNCIDAARYACEAWRKPAPLKIKREAIKAAWNKRRR